MTYDRVGPGCVKLIPLFRVHYAHIDWKLIAAEQLINILRRSLTFNNDLLGFIAIYWNKLSLNSLPKLQDNVWSLDIRQTFDDITLRNLSKQNRQFMRVFFFRDWLDHKRLIIISQLISFRECLYFRFFTKPCQNKRYNKFRIIIHKVKVMCLLNDNIGRKHCSTSFHYCSTCTTFLVYIG